MNAVFLVGFMGAGKSSVGRALGQRLYWIFEDLDDRIEARESRTVAAIFRDSGEAEFRRAEHAALRSVLEELRSHTGMEAIRESPQNAADDSPPRAEGRIIALGGGAFVQKHNAALLKASGLPTIFLDAPVDELWQRCCKQAEEAGSERPLHRSLEDFRKLYQNRRRGYARASVTISTSHRGVEEIAAEIAETLGLKEIGIRIEEGDVE